MNRGLLFIPGPFIDRAKPPISKRVRTGTSRFKVAPALSPERLALLRRALSTMRRKKITVFAFTPPVANEVLQVINSIPEQQKMWREYLRIVPQICREEQTIFCDASTPAVLGFKDDVMFDGIHAMDTFHVAILQRWLRDSRDQALLPGTKERGEALLRAPKTNAWYPDFSAV
jgi:hypothetical protein